ncbi:nitrate reductase molybdenum cofactor assembly chaperone [Virgibacillus oceani]|uniref:Nitrate reductase molybdenum cofactor assembly chaperone n=1 Tax=Virgibacillus oceani TaxID=1479511 RepID=A0A917LYC2_9BACI|nr:nitrate reductase molybdenum cofactor assembly chaperone [Virgibacillus oceani]GGG65824.1 nitrate reductase molybdenum cofactor assembly chaperone [Virgibacillus oceani]
MKAHQKVFKIISTFLQYPDRAWFSNLPELKETIDTIENSTVKTYLNTFMDYLQTTPFNQLCEKYVKTFDFHGISTLNLTYNVFKDSRERGAALVKLRQIFAESELAMETEELPDYLPMILEFLAVADEKLIQRILKLHLNSIKKLESDLAENDSDYHVLLQAAIEISAETLRDVKVS